jgi:type I restriction enzyme S subunit
MGKYKTYEKYKPSGLEWLGDIPEHWSTIRIKFSTYVKGRIGWHGLKSDEFTDEGAYLVTGTDFENNQIDWSRCYHVSLERYAQDPYIQLQNGDLLITKDGTIGKTAIVSGLQEYATLNSGIFLTRPLRQDYLPEFLYWVLNSNCFYDYVNVSQTGTTINHLYQWTFENFAFQLPPIAEQKQIARFLDRETTRIDTLITKKSQLIAFLQKKRDAIIHQAVTKGLEDNVDIVESNIGWLEMIPAHWKSTRLKFITLEITVGIVVTPAKYYVDSGVPCLRSLNVKAGKLVDNDLVFISSESNELHRKSKIYEDDLVVVRSGQPGTTAVVDQRFNGANCIDLIIVRQSQLFNSSYLAYLANSDFSKIQFSLGSGGAIQQHFNVGTAANLCILLPPLKEQQEIVGFLNERVEHLEKTIAKVQESVDLLQREKESLITAAVTGKIDVREEVN